ncbi:phosphotransferase family protein [soil metagenome]
MQKFADNSLIISKSSVLAGLLAESRMTRETQPVRIGEEIDIDPLRAYLLIELGLTGDEIEVEQFPAGSSNLTYLVRIGGGEYVLRRPPFGNTVKTAHDMGREFNVLAKLSQVYPPAPKPLLYCSDDQVIGSEFYLMERRHGIIIRGRVPSQNRQRERADKTPTQSKQASEIESSQPYRLSVCRSFIETLADLHAIDLKDAQLDGLGKPEGYCRRQVEGWSRRYFNAKTDVHPELEQAITWLNDNIPVETGASIIHNDYKFDNVMLDPEDLRRVVGVLDWEMATVGDPLMDLGTTLGYWMSADAPDELLNMPFNPRILMQNVRRPDLVEMYAETSGREIPDMLFYYVFGTFKIAVIAQQIYSRYKKGFTSDERFAGFNKLVGALGSIASRAIEKGSI